MPRRSVDLIPVIRRVAVIGGLGMHPIARLSIPARRLLACLALHDIAITRSLVSGELWPEVSEEAARGNLRRALWHVPPGWITAEGDELILEAETDLSTATQAAQRALDGGMLTFADIILLSADVLPGWHEEWVLPHQRSFHLLRVQALEAACRTMSARNHHALAIQAGSAALAAEPLRESAAEALIEAHLGQHNRFEALQCFRDLAQRLHDELGVEPDAGLSQLVATLGCASVH